MRQRDRGHRHYPAENWEDSKTVSDVEAPTTITCTIDIDP
jgi:hypothetical protein